MSNKIKKRSIFLVLFLTLFLRVQLKAQENPVLDDAYVEINSKRLKDDFFLVKYDFDKDTVYVGLKTLFYFLEIYSLEIDVKNREVQGTIDGKEIDVKFNSENSTIIEDDLYVDLDVLKANLPFSNAEWSGENLKLILTPSFELPYEEREKSKVERIRLEDNRNKKKYKVIEKKKELLAPGLLKIDYVKNDIKSSSESVSLEYGTQLLYGDFYIKQRILPENNLETYKLTYNDVYKENDIVIGDFYLRTPDFLDVNSSVEGVSFGKENTYSSSSDDLTVIEGEAQGADVIELYQNGILIDYLNPSSRDFKFEIRERNYGGEYTLKIYYKNGQIENRKVYTLSDVSILNKGEVDYNLQYGESQGDEQKIFQVNYGLSENITLGVGSMDLVSENDREFSILKGELAFKTSFDSYPTLVSIKNFYEYEKEENSYELRGEQKLKDIDLTYKLNEYSKYLGEENGTKKEQEIGLTKDFENNRIALGYLEEESFSGNKEKGYYVSLENRSFRNLSLFIDTEYTENQYNEKKIEINPGITYTGLGDISLLVQADIEKTEEETTADYSVKLLGRRKKVENTSLEYSFNAEVTYNEDEKFLFTVDFNLYFDDFVYLELPINRSQENKYTAGITAEKVVDLSNIKRTVKDREVDNAWIYGRVYIDKNNNKKYDVGETTLSDVSVIVDGKKYTTNKDGIYTSDGLLPQEDYKVEIDRKTIDPMLKQTENDVRVSTKASVGTEYNIPVQAISMVTGNIIKGEDVTPDEFIRTVSMTTIELEKDGEFYKEIDPEFDGLYFFDDVLPGEYDIKFNYLGNDNIQFSEKKLMVDVKLENEDEGQYFEGYDVLVNKAQDTEEAQDREQEKEDSQDDGFDMESILNNF